MALTTQLAAIERELEDARRRAHRLADSVDEERWQQRPGMQRWSMAECLAHLHLTSRAYLPLIQEAIEKGRALTRYRGGRYRRDLLGWLLCTWAEPPVHFGMKTTAPFIPQGAVPKAQLLAEFDRLQAELVNCLHAANGLDLGRLKITSPFDARFKYNLYSCLKVIPAHQRRHLWQAEEVRRELAPSAGADR